MKNLELLRQWENAVNRIESDGNQWKAKNFSCICSNHFDVSDYMTTKLGSIVLKKDALPRQAITNPDSSELMGMDKPALKRRCLGLQRPLLEIVNHDHNYTKHPQSSDDPQPSQNQQLSQDQQHSQDHQSSQVLYLPVPQSSQVQKPAMEPAKEKKQTQSQYKQNAHKRKIRALQQKLRRQESKATNMKQLINTIKKKLLIKEDEAKLLHNNFDGLNLSLFNNSMKNNTVQACGRRYNSQIKEFAVTVHFYSPKAYNFIRTILPLPAPSMIKSWASSVNCNPGFITEAFDILKQEVKDHPEKKDCCLIFDAMATRKQTSYV